jgi:pimeloyl-ACP methyl ester carboxylesterase
MDLTTGWIEVLAGVASPVFLAVISMFVEALRRPPKPPEKLAWAPGIPIRYVSVGGVKLRYIKAGAGPNLVLLHTLRTQLDIFQKVIPELSREFTVYAPAYPGHGYSDIPKAEYDANFFVRVVEGFLDALNLHDVTLCGVSIGGSICLILAGAATRASVESLQSIPTTTQKAAAWRAARFWAGRSLPLLASLSLAKL